MDPERYCFDTAAPPGSSLYYATLFAGPGERAALVAVHALRQTLLEIVEGIVDPNVRAHKLNWWSDEIMAAREGRARHPVAVALTRHCGEGFWRRPEVLAMLSAVARVSAAGGFASVAARDRFCEDVGGGTARLCATVATLEPDEAVLDQFRTLGGVLEAATLAGIPNVRSGLDRIPAPAPDTRSGAFVFGLDHLDSRLRGNDGSNAGSVIPAKAGIHESCAIEAREFVNRTRMRSAETARVDPDNGARRIVEERVRARDALADATGNLPLRACPAMLVYRTLARIQLAALANALRQPAATVPASASITPIRKLWIAWRTARQGGAR